MRRAPALIYVDVRVCDVGTALLYQNFGFCALDSHYAIFIRQIIDVPPADFLYLVKSPHQSNIEKNSDV